MKTLKTLSFLLMSGLLTLSCGEQPTVTSTDHDGGEPIIVDAPDIIIPVQEAEDLYHRYGDVRVPLIEESINIDDEGNPISEDDDAYVQATRSLSIDYKTLKQYLNFIEQEAGAANTDISGLRIYFGNYADSKNDGRATVFMNPLMAAGTKIINDDVSFAIRKEDGKSIAVPVGKLIKVPNSKSNRADLTMPVQGTIQSLAGNDFPWNPPPNGDENDFH